MAHEVLQDYYLNTAVVQKCTLMIPSFTGRNVSNFSRSKFVKLVEIFSESSTQLSDERVQGIRQIPEPTSLKAVRGFIGKV